MQNSTQPCMNVDIDSVEVKLSGSPILRGISARIPAGGSAAIVGASGCGKTTLLRCVAGLMKPSAGRVTIGGGSPVSLYGRGVLAYLFQEPYLWKHLSVRDTLRLTLKLVGESVDREKIDALLDRVGLTQARSLYPHQLSVGMKARVAIARAFCSAPKVLLMDEPFAAIDPLRRLSLNMQVQQLRMENGSTTLWATHDVVEALQFATMIIAISPHPFGTATIIDVNGLPPIADNASLPPEALRTRDRILDIIQGQVSSHKEDVLATA